MPEPSDLGNALGAKKEKRAREGAEDAERAATGRSAPSSVDACGPHARRLDDEERPRRAQMNVDVPEDLREEFRRACQEDGRQMRFVVEDLVRLYLRRRDAE
jgi:hypothetical protein